MTRFFTSPLPAAVLFAGILGAVALLYVYDDHPRVGAAEIPPELSREEYNEIRDGLLLQVHEADPRAAIEELKRLSAANTSVSRSCHELLHEVGRAAYEKYTDISEALRFIDDYCISGYPHGVMEAYFPAIDDLTKAIQDVCTPYSKGSLRSWGCFHGIGHGLMYLSGNDLPGSLALCETIPDMESRSACANGAYMENFNADPLMHPSRYLRSDDFMYPCNTAGFDHKGDCYMNAPIYFLRTHEYDFRAALDWCNSAEGSYSADCVYGVGGQAARRNISDWTFLASVCEYNPVRTESCIAGVVSSLVGYHFSLDEARAFCEGLSSREKEACGKSVSAFTLLE